MKAILEFNLPEEEEDHINAVKGTQYKIAIDSLYESVFRPSLKHERPIIGDKLTPEHHQLLQAIWVLIDEHFEECKHG